MAGFIARKRLHMGDGLYREYGEPVPEAEGWLNRDAAVRCGEIERVSDRDYDEACARWEARKRAAAEKAQAEALAALSAPAPEPAEALVFPSAEVSIHVEPRAEPEPEAAPDISADLRGGSEPVEAPEAEAEDPAPADYPAPRTSKRSRRGR